MNETWHNLSKSGKGRNALPVFIVTGDIAEGKTTFIKQLVQALQKEGIKPAGFYSPRILDRQNTIGYDLISIATEERIAFLRENTKNLKHDIGKFSVSQDSFDQAHQWLIKAKLNENKLIIIDEVGKWELEGKGWKKEIDELFTRSEIPQLWVVRRNFVDEVLAFWKLKNAVIFDIANDNPESVVQQILLKLNQL
jgi:nucleoside-triphosphatase